MLYKKKSRGREKHLAPRCGTQLVAFLQMLQELTHLQDIYYLPANRQKRIHARAPHHKLAPRRLWPNSAKSV